jgi:hypothetical protein
MVDVNMSSMSLKVIEKEVCLTKGPFWAIKGSLTQKASKHFMKGKVKKK